VNLTTEQLRTLRHMLGINDPWMRVPVPSRDYYCANPEDPKMVALDQAGAVERYSTHGSYWWYSCTDAGRAAAMASYRTIRKSKASRVYRRWLSIRDCFADLTFRDFGSPE